MVQVEGIAPPMPISRRRVYSALHCCSATPGYKWEHGSDSHRQPSPYEGDTLLVELPCCEMVGKAGSGTWTRTTILRSKAACPTIRRSRNERGESGQADGICTRFPAFTGRCPSDWAACLKVMVRAGRFALPIPRSQAECVGCYATPG